MVDVDKKYVAQILQNARKKQGLKQSELAEKVGISVIADKVGGSRNETGPPRCVVTIYRI